MGAAQEKRFLKFNREYFDRFMDSPAVREREHVSNLEDEVKTLRAQLRESQAELARAKNCVERQRVYLSAAYEQVSEARALAELNHGEMMKWFRAFRNKNRAWLKLSRMVRELNAPEIIARWREEHKDE